MKFIFQYSIDEPNLNQAYWELLCHVSKGTPPCQTGCYFIFEMNFYLQHSTFMSQLYDANSMKNPGLN